MLRFLTLEPLDLRRRPKQAENEARTQESANRLEALLAGNAHRWFEITGGFSPGTGPGAGLRRAVEYINKVRRARERLDLPKRRPAANEEPPSRKVNLAATFLVHINRFAQAMLVHPLLPRHFLAHRRPPSLLSLSCSAKQLSLRLSQISSFPSLAAKLRRQRQLDALGAHDLSRSYVATWNALWLMSNDVLLGMATSAILWTCKDSLATWLSNQVIERRLVHDIVSACQWLDDWPGGLKLNTELSSFYLDMYVGLVSLSWQTLLRPCIVQPLPTLLGIIARVGQYGGGLALQLCLLTDLARLATLHLRFLHALARSQYSAMLHLVVTLLDLFRGKKRTLLSPRAATRGWELVNAHYDLDQLLLGAIFFTLILFLAPTVAVYHWLFALLVAAVEVVLRFVLVQGLVEAINHLPLLSLVLRLKDPDRVPGGVAIVIEDEGSAPVEGLKYTARRLESHPLPWAEVLRQGFDGHFVGTVGALPRLAKAIFTGEDVSRSGASAGSTS